MSTAKINWPQEPVSHPESLKALRQAILEQIHLAKSGHPGGSLSMLEILTSIFQKNFKQDPENQKDPERDRLVLSKGHGVPALYALYSRLNYFDSSELKHFRAYGHFLQGHPDHLRFPLMEASTGSLGQGVSVALGLALGLRLQFQEGKISRLPKVYCVLGDGEAQEGQVWECLMACGKFQPGNLCFVLDYNKGQIDGPTNEVMSLEPIVDKLKGFNLDVHNLDGHQTQELEEYFSAWEAKPEAPVKFLVAQTVKGKGVSFMENNIGWHGKAPSQEELNTALNEIYEGPSRPYGSLIS